MPMFRGTNRMLPCVEINIVPLTVSVAILGSIPVTITSTWKNGFSGNLTLSASYQGGSLPAKLTAVFGSTTLTPAAPTTTLTFSAALALTLATYPITVTATGNGCQPATDTVSVTAIL